MSEASNSKAIEGQRDVDKHTLEALQAEYRKSLEKLRRVLQREVMLKKLWADLDGDAHHFE